MAFPTFNPHDASKLWTPYLDLNVTTTNHDPPANEICFSFDTTGSMYLSIIQLREHVREMINKMINSVPNLKIALFAHGDYCDRNYVTKYVDFTDDVDALSDFLENLEGTNGGDWEECYELVLHEVRTKLSWSRWSHKSLVMIGDAIPHEVPPSGKFGNHIVYDWRQEVQMLALIGVSVHGIECCMPMCQSLLADDFWNSLTRMGNGKLVRLQDALVNYTHTIKDAVVAMCFYEYNKEMLRDFELEVCIRDGLNVKPEVMKMFGSLLYPIMLPFQESTSQRTAFNMGLPFGDLQYSNQPEFTHLPYTNTRSEQLSSVNAYNVQDITETAMANNNLLGGSQVYIDFPGEHMTGDNCGKDPTRVNYSISDSGDSGIEVDASENTTIIRKDNAKKRSVEDTDSDECLLSKRPRFCDNGKRKIDDVDVVDAELNPPKRLKTASDAEPPKLKAKRSQRTKRITNREQVTEKDFEFKNLHWSPWYLVYSCEPLDEHWAQTHLRKQAPCTEHHTVYRNNEMFDESDDNSGLYEVAVQAKGQGRRHPMYVCHSGTGFKSKQWQSRLFGRSRLTTQIDDVLKDECRVFIRKGKPAKETRAVKNNITNLYKKMTQVYDYAWNVKGFSKTRHRQVKRCGVTISNKKY